MTDARKLLKQNDEKGIWFWSSTLLFFHRVLNLWSCIAWYWRYFSVFFHTPAQCIESLLPCSFKLSYIDSLSEWWERRLCTLPCSRVLSHNRRVFALLPCCFTRILSHNPYSFMFCSRVGPPVRVLSHVVHGVYWIFSGARSPTFYPLILLFHPTPLFPSCVFWPASYRVKWTWTTSSFSQGCGPIVEHFWKKEICANCRKLS